VTEEQVFLAALDQPDAGARNAYLAEACGDDVQLRAKVEGLLAAHFNSGEFLDVPAPQQISIEPTVDSGLSHAVTIASEVMPAHQDPSHESDSLEFLAPPTRPDSLGRIDHYEVLQVLGTGGFGIVFRAFDDVLQRVVAIKVMAPLLAATSPARKRFLREARASAQVRHEHVVQVYEVGEQPLPYLVMEFIPGETLQQRVDRVGPLDVLETVQISRQVAEGLAAAHAMDLIHRDIKPGNVLLEGGQHKVKITDFGLARTADDASVTQSGQIAGTPMYMAPEQALGHPLDHRVDLFSLGSVMYQMVAGRPPFRANTAVAVLKRVVDDTPRNIREVIPETPQWLCDIIAKLHAKKPDDRYQSAREVADVLANCEAQLKQSSRLRDFSRIPREKSAPRQSGRRTWAIVAGVLLLTFAAFWFGPTALLYLSNRGSLKLLPEEGLISVIVLENNEGDLVTDKLHTPMTDWLDLTEKSHTLRLPPGRYQLNVSTWPAGTRVSQWAISNTGLFGSDQVTVPVIDTSAIVTVERGHRVTLRAVVHKPAADPTLVSVAPETEGEWVQLFNGKDLTGWSTFDKQWTVRDGILVGQGTKGYLHTLREDFRDFHLRSEVKVAEGSNSGIYFRSSFVDKVRHGYEAEVSLTKEALQTGSLQKFPSRNWLLQQQRRQLLQHDRWCLVEIIAVGNHLVVKVDGNTTADLDDVDFERGHFGLQLSQDATSHVEFRKIEIKELPASPPPSDGFVQLFNGKELTGWKPLPEEPGHWEVKDGILVGSQRRGVLLSERGDFADFHLRVQVKINLGGDSGILFRAGSKLPQGGGYEAEIHKNRAYARNTGTIEAIQAGPPIVLGLTADDSLTKPDEWFEMEVIAEGGRFTMKINGQEAATCSVPTNPHAAGHIGLQVWNPNTVVQFRKIEIKELPASPPPSDGFVALFNGKDLTGWKKHSLSGGDWRVEDGAIDGRGTTTTTSTSAWRRRSTATAMRAFAFGRRST
jgi:serine/threonine protein kinase